MTATNPTITDRSLALSTTSATILAANPSRHSIIMQNTDASISIGIRPGGSAASIGAAGTLTLAAGASITFEGPNCPQDAFTAIAASGTPVLTIWEVS